MIQMKKRKQQKEKKAQLPGIAAVTLMQLLTITRSLY